LLARRTHRILDRHERAIVTLCPGPADADGWHKDLGELGGDFQLLAEEYEEDVPDTRRGAYVAVDTGVSMGMGSMEPARWVKKTKRAEDLEERLLGNRILGNVAGWQSTLLCYAYPRIWLRARHTMARLRQRRPHVKFNFPGRTVYSSMTANMGPQTVTLPHLDSLNYPGCPCAVTAWGHYNPDLGGHLYFPTLRIYIRFPPGCTVFLSSAALRHGNIAVQEGEIRYSVTQYMSGGLVRWVQAKGRRVNQMLGEGERTRVDGAPGDNWKRQMARFPTPATLESQRESVRRQALKEKAKREEWKGR
ncbi:uncharacterized protein BXZ73DRAFT_46974, partial [Epithele typhae]|uniref:uncharacterized protein n=1 Tax=Epithele typhae TaxID=378194 RepID=UPI002007B6A7